MYNYDRRRRTAMEFATEEAMKKYLQAHPKADPKNHSVGKPKEKGPSSAKTQGKGGPGKQRSDWVKTLTDGYTTSNPKRQAEIQKLRDAASSLDIAEATLAEYTSSSPTDFEKRILPYLKKNFEAYNSALHEAFGDDSKESEPEWKAPKVKKPKKDSDAPKAKEPEKDEKKPAEKKKAPRDLSRDVQNEIAKKHGIVDDVQHISEDENGWVYAVNTEKAELTVVIDRETGKIKKVEVDKDLEEDDYAAGRKKRK